MTRRPVSRLGRKLDIVSLIFIVAGATVFLAAFFGMRELRDLRQSDSALVTESIEAYAALNRYYRLQRLSYLGLGLGALGIVVALSAAAHNRKFSKTGWRNSD